MRRIPSLDGFRAISIALVLISHSRFSNGFPFQNSEMLLSNVGSLGVTVFFVISGFLITYLLLTEEAERKEINLKYFYIRRVLRIFPVYFLYCIFVFALKNHESIVITTNNFIHIVSFTTNFDKHIFSTFQHFWSLSVEEQFYLIWPISIVLFRKNLKVVIIAFLLLSSIFRITAYKFPHWEISNLNSFFDYSDSIFIGALGGILFFENKQPYFLRFFKSYFSQIALIGVIILLRYSQGMGKLGYITIPFGNTIISFCILYIIFNYIIISEGSIFKFLNNKIIIHIGVLSYSIYIWQQFFLYGQTGFYRIFPYNHLIVYSVALCSYYFWELPFLKLKKRFTKY